MTKTKIEIKSYLGNIIFKSERETIKEALQDAVLQDAVLRGAVLQGADLQGADLRDADLRGITLEKLPRDFINQCSRDILFILQSLKAEVPFLKEKLLKGEIDGSQYEGDCACLIGTLANANGGGVGTLADANGGIDKVCAAIPFYEKGTHNMGEKWFLNIKKGDTPENNEFAAHVLKLIEMVEKVENK